MAGHQVASTTALIDGFRDLIRAPLDDLLARQIMAAAGPGHIEAAVDAGDRSGPRSDEGLRHPKLAGRSCVS